MSLAARTLTNVGSIVLSDEVFRLVCTVSDVLNDRRLTFRIAARDAAAIALVARSNGRSAGAELRAAVAGHLSRSLNETRPACQPGDVEAEPMQAARPHAP